jgi:hypothetical protein
MTLMKKAFPLRMPQFYLFLFALLGVASTVRAQAHAGEYMTQISQTYEPIKKETWDYMTAVGNGRSAKKIDKRRKDLLLSMDVASGTLRKMKPWEGDASYRDSSLAYLRMSKIVLNEDYGRIVDMEEVAEQSYDAMEAYLLARKKANEKYKAAAALLQVAAQDFADRHNVNLLSPDDDKLSQKIEQAGKVFDYYDKAFLVMFKAQVEENYAIAALAKADMSGAEQNRNKMAEYSKEGLKSAAGMGAFESDNSLKLALEKMLTFFKTEAEVKMPTLIDFYLKKENFEKMKKAIDSKPKNQLTDTEVDQFNKAVNDYNAAIGTYNKTNDELNSARSKAFTDWNNAATGFMQKHVPNR